MFHDHESGIYLIHVYLNNLSIFTTLLCICSLFAVKWAHINCFKLNKKFQFEDFLANLRGFPDLDASQQGKILYDRTLLL